MVLKESCMKICIVVPMHNEEAMAKKSLETIIGYASQLPIPVTTVVINDGSTDRTLEIVNSVAHNSGKGILEVVTHQNKMGYGAALRTGMKYAIDNDYGYALFMDCDLTNHPRYLSLFYDKIKEGYEYIKATRYAEGGNVRGVPLFRMAVSIIGNGIARLLYRLPLTDPTNGFRAVKIDVLKKMDLKEPGFPIIMEELYQAKSITSSFCEVPYVLTARKETDGRTHFSYSLATCLKYFKYALKGFVTLSR